MKTSITQSYTILTHSTDSKWKFAEIHDVSTDTTDISVKFKSCGPSVNVVLP
jgi:hypothetical protein